MQHLIGIIFAWIKLWYFKKNCVPSKNNLHNKKIVFTLRANILGSRNFYRSLFINWNDGLNLNRTIKLWEKVSELYNFYIFCSQILSSCFLKTANFTKYFLTIIFLWMLQKLVFIFWDQTLKNCATKRSVVYIFFVKLCLFIKLI